MIRCETLGLYQSIYIQGHQNQSQLTAHLWSQFHYKINVSIFTKKNRRFIQVAMFVIRCPLLFVTRGSVYQIQRLYEIYIITHLKTGVFVGSIITDFSLTGMFIPKLFLHGTNPIVLILVDFDIKKGILKYHTRPERSLFEKSVRCMCDVENRNVWYDLITC